MEMWNNAFSSFITASGKTLGYHTKCVKNVVFFNASRPMSCLLLVDHIDTYSLANCLYAVYHVFNLHIWNPRLTA